MGVNGYLKDLGINVCFYLKLKARYDFPACLKNFSENKLKRGVSKIYRNICWHIWFPKMTTRKCKQYLEKQIWVLLLEKDS